MQDSFTIIPIVWDTPVPYDRISEFVHDTDFGIYAIYGTHPKHGSDTLLYIGRALGGSFGWRIPQHKDRLESELVTDIRVQLGRIVGNVTPSDEDWNRQIELAERLIIFAHKPPLNTHLDLGGLEPVLQTVHICNWGVLGSIFPEISGLRWTTKGEGMAKIPFSTKPLPNQLSST